MNTRFFFNAVRPALKYFLKLILFEVVRLSFILIELDEQIADIEFVF